MSETDKHAGLSAAYQRESNARAHAVIAASVGAA